MGGYDDHVAVMGDWMALSPSPRPFLPSMIGDDITAQSVVDSVAEIRNGPHFAGPEEINASGINSDQKDQTQATMGSDEPRLSSKVGLMERIAARAGFNAPRLDTESIRPADLSNKQEVRSPYLTIPPGLSPTTLLDSPVFIQNSQVLPSPTTGQFLFAPGGNNHVVNPDDLKENTFQDFNASSFTFKPVAESAQFPYFNAANKSFPSDVAVSDHPNNSLRRQSIGPPTVQSENNNPLFQQPSLSEIHTQNNEYNSVGVVEHSPPFDQDADQRSSEDPNLGGTASEDGYNWRKYGQKQVKGSEFPRSYYKCTHQNCPVKKKVERSQEGHITEIIYKGAHNHPKPPPSRRSALGSSNDVHLDSEQPATNVAADWKPMMVQEHSNVAAPPINFQPESGGARYESGDGIDRSSAYSKDEAEDDRATHASASLGYDGEGDESESKRRKVEAYPPEMTGPTRAIREPRVVVQTTSEVDILDDGYRWRKYGQKVVKGNPNPRSYYKCTSPGCNVRKHVERACHDLKSVITTYEGKHNHDVPAARNSGSQSQSQMQRSEGSQIRGGSPWFGRAPLASFSLPGRPQLGPGPGFGFGSNQHGLGGLGLPGLGPDQGKLPVLPVNPYMGNGVRPVNEMVYRGEPKMEPVTDGGLNSSNGSTAYQQFMNQQQM